MTWFKERPALCFFFVALIIYNSNLRPIPSTDTVPASLLPVALMLGDGLHLDRFDAVYAERSKAFGGAYFLHHSRGHVWSSYPIGTPVFLAPFYTPILLIPNLNSWSVEE